MDTGERYAVEVLGVAHLDTAQVETHDGGIVATGQEDIALSLFPLPRKAIERVVLMLYRSFGLSLPRCRDTMMQDSECPMMLPFFFATITGDISVVKGATLSVSAREVSDFTITLI